MDLCIYCKKKSLQSLSDYNKQKHINKCKNSIINKTPTNNKSINDFLNKNPTSSNSYILWADCVYYFNFNFDVKEHFGLKTLKLTML